MSQTADVAYGDKDVISRKELKPLVARTNSHGLTWLACHASLLALTGALVYASSGSWWMVPAIMLHGGIMAFLFAPVHECSHRTPFRSLRLNETVYWALCFIYIVPPTFFRYSPVHLPTQCRTRANRVKTHCGRSSACAVNDLHRESWSWKTAYGYW